MPVTDVQLGSDVKIFHHSLVNLYGCRIGDHTKVGSFVEIQKNARIGARCKISSHTFVCEGVVIDDEVFIGHGVMFINDRYPQAANVDGSLQTEADWKVEPTRVKRRASIGSNATIMCGVSIGEGALVGAGAVVWAAQKLLKYPIDQAFAFEYAVTGSWADPKVEKLGQPPPKAAEEGK